MGKVFGAIFRYLKQTDLFLIFITLISSIYGTVLVYSATQGGTRTLIVQAGCIVAGFIGMIILSKVDYHDIAGAWKWIAILGVIMLLSPYLHLHRVSGSEDLSWLNLGFTTVQPSEFVKFLFVITFAKHYDLVKDNIRSLRNVLLLGVHAAVPLGIIVIQKDMGMALVFLLMFAFMMFAGNVQLRYFVGAAILLLITGPTIIWNKLFKGTQRLRIIALFDQTSTQTLKDTASQQISARMAIGSGEFWGYGLFHGPRTQSAVSSGLLPERQNDMIFAVAGEELGFVGCLLIILLFVALFARILADSRQARDPLGSMICIGAFAAFAIQMMINLGMVLMLLPVIGITLPFFSAGGSSVLSSYLAIGMVLSVRMHRNNSLFVGQES